MLGLGEGGTVVTEQDEACPTASDEQRGYNTQLVKYCRSTPVGDNQITTKS